MSRLTNGLLALIGIQTPITSGQHRKNYSAIQNAHNELEDKVSLINTGTSNAETTAARPYNTDLGERLNQKGQDLAPVVLGGLLVTEQTVPDMTVQISTGTASIFGVQTKTTSILNTGTITAPTNSRYDIVAMNSDNTVSVLTGNDSVDPVLPSVSSLQRPLAVLTLLSSTTTITDSIIADISNQGCTVNSRWFFKISDAIADLGSRTNSLAEGEIFVKAGSYYEELDVSGIGSISIIGEGGSRVYRPDDTSYCIKSVNTVSNETTGIRIEGLELFGNGKIGAIELMKFEYTDKFNIEKVSFDGNSSSTATYKDFLINQCDDFRLDNNIIDDYATTNISNATKYFEDGYFMGQVVYAGTTAQKTELVKMGFTELTAMANKFPRVESGAGNTGGVDSHDLSHNHKWYDLTTFSTSDNSFDSAGNSSSISGDFTARTGGKTMSVHDKADGNASRGNMDADRYTDNDLSASTDNKPAYYSLIALIHR